MLGHFHDLDALDFRPVFEDRRAAVDRLPVQVAVPVATPVLRLTVRVLAAANEFIDVSSFHTTFDTAVYDVLL